MKKNFKKMAETTLMAASLMTLPAMANSYETMLIAPNPMAQDYFVTVNNEEVRAEVYENEGFTMIKLRDVADKCGLKLLWNPETEMMGVEFGENKFEMKPGENSYLLNDEKGMFYGKAEIKEGRTYISSDFFEMVGMICVVDGNIVKLISKEALPENSAVIMGISKGVITVQDVKLGEVELVLSEETKIYDEEENEITLEDLYTGAVVEVAYSEAMTLSLPPMNNPTALRLCAVELAQELEVEGIVSEVGENYVILKDVAEYQNLHLNIDDNTSFMHISGNRRLYRINDITTEMKIKAVVSNAFTRSLPAQTYAYGIIICE